MTESPDSYRPPKISGTWLVVILAVICGTLGTFIWVMAGRQG